MDRKLCCEIAIPIDGGPIYTETDLTGFPVEPWNTFSVLPFLFVSIFWWTKIKNNWKAYKVLTLGLALLLIGFIGGTVYHACRCDKLWFRMDYVPIACIAALAALTFWYILFAV